MPSSRSLVAKVRKHVFPVSWVLVFCIVLTAVGRETTAQETAPAPLPPQRAPSKMTLPEGFSATLFAGEPDVVQPISFTFDERGRMWVVECLSYPDWETAGRDGHDRIVILDDTDGDGHFDTRIVFWDQGANLTSVEVGFGGVWACATPNLLFIPDADHDDTPDGPPVVVLDGWDLKARHNVFNGLTWGPDGWLYGCNGILSNSLVGHPGTPDAERVALNCGVWRYHPTSKIFEAVAAGSTNPWGLDFDDNGQMFITNCVIKHLFHVIPGGHYDRMFGQDINPYSYGLMESCADHIHWAGGDWQSSRGGKGIHNQPGGGHAHSGAMVYLGDSWPAEYRNRLFTCNIHGNRINQDTLERQGSGYVARHANDFLYANDEWFRGLVVKGGPDGSVFVSDWTDSGECHDYDDVHRTSGRIYKVAYGTPSRTVIDLREADDSVLVQFQLHDNDWYVRQARRILQERAAQGTLQIETPVLISKLLEETPNPSRRLRLLWAMHVVGGLNENELLKQFHDSNEFVRGWAIQLLLEDRHVSDMALTALAKLAVDDESPVVRLYLAAGLQRMSSEERWRIAGELVKHGDDAGDQNIPLMTWYGIEPLVAEDPARAIDLLSTSNLPIVREFLVRRIVSLTTPANELPQLTALVDVLADSSEPQQQLDIVRGMYAGLEGRRNVGMPTTWPAVADRLGQSPELGLREKTMQLSVIFGDPQVLASLRELIADSRANPQTREAAIAAMVQDHDQELLPILQSLISDDAVRSAAIRGLAAYADDATPTLLLRNLADWNDFEKQDAVNTLASRPTWALQLLRAVEEKQVPATALNAMTARQLSQMKDPQVSQLLAKVWGSIRPTADEKLIQLADFKALLTGGNLGKANRSQGRLVFSKTCAGCHRLFDDGRPVGPDLTGSQRTNLDYVLQNVIDPNALVGRAHQVTIIVTTNGRILTGIVSSENANVVRMETATETVLVPVADIEERQQSGVSMMPEGLLNKLSPTEIRDLVAYLASPMQVPLPEADGSGH